MRRRRDREPAMLKCEGKPSCGDFVLHQFLKTRPCSIKNEGGVLQNGNEELYSCAECGTARRWGLGTSG